MSHLLTVALIYLAGFATAAALTIWWYHGSLKPKLQALEAKAAAAFMSGIDTASKGLSTSNATKGPG